MAGKPGKSGGCLRFLNRDLLKPAHTANFAGVTMLNIIEVLKVIFTDMQERETH